MPFFFDFLYQCIFHEEDGSLTESYGLMFE